MNVKKFVLVLFLTGISLLISGCEKQESVTEPETVIDFLVPAEEPPAETDYNPDAAAVPPTETAVMPEQASAAEPASASEPQSQGTASAGQNAQNTQSHAPETPQASNAVSDEWISVSQTFHVTDTWTSDISFQIPKDWSYTVDEDPTDWGFDVSIPGQEDLTLRIHALPGTFNVESSYTAAPTDFVTTSGMNGKFYQKKSAGDDGATYIDGDIVFAQQPSSGISFLMPEDTYEQYLDTLQKVFLSVTIKDTYLE